MFDLNTDMNSITSEAKHEKKKCGMLVEMSEKVVIYGQSLNIVGAVLFSIWYYKFTTSYDEDPSLYKYLSKQQYVGPPIGALSYVFLLYGPLPCAADFVICHMINSLENLFENWKSILRYKTPTNFINICTQNPSNNVLSDTAVEPPER